MSVNAYFSAAAAAAPAAVAQMPQVAATAAKTVATTAPGYTADSYVGMAPAGMQVLDKFMPFIPGAWAGIKAKASIIEAKGHFLRARATSSAKVMAKATANGRGAFFEGVLGAVKSSVIINGLLSLVVNGYKVAKKQETVADGGSKVTGDLTSAVVAGTAGALLSTAATMVLGATSLAGLPLTLVCAGAGIVGYTVADKLLRKSTIFQSLTGGVHRLLGGG